MIETFYMLNNAYGSIQLHRVLWYINNMVSFRLAGSNLTMNREKWTLKDNDNGRETRITAVLNGRQNNIESVMVYEKFV